MAHRNLEGTAALHKSRQTADSDLASLPLKIIAGEFPFVFRCVEIIYNRARIGVTGCPRQIFAEDFACIAVKCELHPIHPIRRNGFGRQFGVCFRLKRECIERKNKCLPPLEVNPHGGRSKIRAGRFRA